VPINEKHIDYTKEIQKELLEHFKNWNFYK
jgi:hypothetical protein